MITLKVKKINSGQWKEENTEDKSYKIIPGKNVTRIIDNAFPIVGWKVGLSIPPILLRAS